MRSTTSSATLARQVFMCSETGCDSKWLLGLPLLDDRKCIVPEQRLRRSKIFIDDRPVVDATAFFENHRYHRLILASGHHLGDQALF